MNFPEMIGAIASKEYNKLKYVDAIESEEEFRTFIIEQMISSQDIMIYYHCYEIVATASNRKPELFYPYWASFRKLLRHDNSYHRDIGLTILANLSQTDTLDLLTKMMDEYLEHLYDAKFMTARCCVRNCTRIMIGQPTLIPKIVRHLLAIEEHSQYPPKQKELLMGDIIAAFAVIYDRYDHQAELLDFVKRNIQSSSPKTRRSAKDFIRKYEK